MSYQPPRQSKIILAALAVSLITVYIAAPFWEPAKQGYFGHVVTSCGIKEAEWEEIPSFDAGSKRWAARNDADLATLECIDRWAGIIITDKTPDGISAEMEGYPAIKVTEWGGNYAPPQQWQRRSFIQVRN